ncbi:MAG: DUF4268 domain-containing protein [Pirellulaceae bacterium]
MPTNQPLGRLTSVTLREAWLSEAGDFTPWLAEDENIQLLSETIGIDLEVEAIEKNVGPFRADILCKDTTTDQWVLIENQLEKTDHTHLGQLITYAAGLNTVTIVWVSRRFREEHRAALDWLNQVTSEDISFFGLEVELWKIGDSPLAPKFNIVSSPNDWQKNVRDTTTGIGKGPLPPARNRRLKFWTGFVDFLSDQTCRFRPGKPHSKPAMWFSLGRTGIRLVAVASHGDMDDDDELRAEISMGKETSQAFYNQLLAQRQELEAALGTPLNWFTSEHIKRKRIYLRHSIDLKDESQWPAYYQWLLEKLNALHEVFAPRVARLKVDFEESATYES